MNIVNSLILLSYAILMTPAQIRTVTTIAKVGHHYWGRNAKSVQNENFFKKTLKTKVRISAPGV